MDSWQNLNADMEDTYFENIFSVKAEDKRGAVVLGENEGFLLFEI